MDSFFEYLQSSLYAIYNALLYIPCSDIVFNYIKESYQNDPFRILLEGLLVIFTIRYLTSKKYRLDGDFIPLSQQEIDMLVDEWEPEPLVPLEMPELAKLNAVSFPELQGPIGPTVVLTNGQKLINLTSFNFLGLANSEKMKTAAISALKTYGVGTCGPPGFYGTLDVHLELERAIAEFLNAEAAIIYSQAFSAVSSVIPAFSKRGDILVVDEGVHFAIQKGVQISRSHVHFFKHNDIEDLERVLQLVASIYDKKSLSRRFIVVEGLYMNSGDILPLPEIIKLKEKYKYRIICDETLSIGVLGAQGRGISEHYGVNFSEALDIVTGSLSHTFGSNGGFCAGSLTAIHHQRLSGQGYCFSASLPALLAVAALTSITELKTHAKELLYKLKYNTQLLYKGIAHMKGLKPRVMSSTYFSPLVHLELITPKNTPEEEAALLQKIVDEGIKKGLLLTRAKYVESQENQKIRQSIRIVISAAFSQTELECIIKRLAQVMDVFF